MKFVQYKTQQMTAMSNLFNYVVAAVLFITWFLGFMVFDTGREIHFVFLAAVLVLIYRIFVDHASKNNK